MNFYKVINRFDNDKRIAEGNIILVNPSSHPKCGIVVLSTAANTGAYIHQRPTRQYYYDLEKRGDIIPLTPMDLWKASHHMPWRIWTMDASPLLNSATTALDAMDILANSSKKTRLIPPAICMECMKKGNPSLVKAPPIIDKLGTCRICGKRDTLRATAFAAPLNFRPAFGRFIAPLDFAGFEEDIPSFKEKFIVEEWWKLYGYKETNTCPDGYELIDGKCQKSRELLLEDLRVAENKAEELSAMLLFAEEKINKLEEEIEKHRVVYGVGYDLNGI